jgi:hypothetical protein
MEEAIASRWLLGAETIWPTEPWPHLASCRIWPAAAAEIGDSPWGNIVPCRDGAGLAAVGAPAGIAPDPQAANARPMAVTVSLLNVSRIGCSVDMANEEGPRRRLAF